MDQLTKVLANTGLENHLDARGFMRLLDMNGNGKLDFQELMCGLAVLCEGTWEERLRLCFDCFDADGCVPQGAVGRAIGGVARGSARPMPHEGGGPGVVPSPPPPPPKKLHSGFPPPRGRGMPTAVRMPAVVRMPACHGRGFKGERPIGAATG